MNQQPESGKGLGKVSLVGAGPGDPGLMTARALELIAEADVIFYDRLIPPGALAGAREEAELVYVGKMPGTVHNPQADINRRIVQAAREGGTVVRLKGGDPFIFGRGGEEAEELADAGIPFEVVPGVTAAIAVTATAGIPLTHREDSAGVAFVTGHRDADGDQNIDPDGALAKFPGTLAFYMGVKRLADNAADLIAGGRPADQPAAAIERGATPQQRVVTATLGTIAAEVERQGIRPPALIVIGNVVRHHEKLAWFEKRPLFGRRVVVTRAKHQAGTLAALLRGQGAEVIEMPVIEAESIPASDRRVEAPFQSLRAGNFDLVCFTSPNGVAAFFELVADEGLDARLLAGTKVAAIGPGTARALRPRGIEPDLVPGRAVAEGLLERLESEDLDGQRILIPRAETAREVLPEGLAARGAQVTIMPLYRTVPVTPEQTVIEQAAAADAITFTSASTVSNLLAAVPGGLPGVANISMGPITSEAIREAGLEVAGEAESGSLAGLAAAVGKALA
jgi:uroporphyrinogen III methyltransferase/synthase